MLAGSAPVVRVVKEDQGVFSRAEAAAVASLQRKGLQARMLSSEEEERLHRDQALVSDFKQQKLEKEAQKNWDLFYKRNSTNFFKDRHWTTREFEELRSCREGLWLGPGMHRLAWAGWQ